MHNVNHREYTALAVDIYREYSKHHIESKIFKSALSQGAYDEDGFNPLELDMQRMFNWHFYNNQNSIGDNPLFPGSRTSEKRVNILISKIIKAKQRYKDEVKQEDREELLEGLLDAAGRFIHHIQDMSTFSHVVPVYHDMFLKDSYEVFGEKLVDKINVSLQDHSRSSNRLSISIRAEEIKKNNSEYGGPDRSAYFGIYTSAAEKTLEVLKSDKHAFTIYVNGEEEAKRWHSFWKEKRDKSVAECAHLKNKHDDFGSFGELCNNFGKAFFEIDENFYEVDHSEYLKIYKYIMKKSILDTVSVIEKVFSDLKL